MAILRTTGETLNGFDRTKKRGDYFLKENFVRKVSVHTTIEKGDEFVLVDGTDGSITITLPKPDEGRKFFIKKTDSSGNPITIETPGDEKIDGNDSHSLTGQYDGVTIIGDGDNYFII